MSETRPEKLGRYSIIDENVKFGKNVYVGNFVHIRPNVILGDDVEIRDYCFIAPDVEIGTGSIVYQFCNIAMGTKIGKHCFVGAGTVTANDKVIRWPRQEKFIPDPVIIKDLVRIGMRAVILPGVVLEEGCRIGAGAVVTKSTEAYLTYVGNPAKAMLKRWSDK